MPGRDKAKRGIRNAVHRGQTDNGLGEVLPERHAYTLTAQVPRRQPFVLKFKKGGAKI